jgi:hypothetical protein
MGSVDVHTTFWWRKLRERGHMEDQGKSGNIILIWIFRK